MEVAAPPDAGNEEVGLNDDVEDERPASVQEANDDNHPPAEVEGPRPDEVADDHEIGQNNGAWLGVRVDNENPLPADRADNREPYERDGDDADGAQPEINQMQARLCGRKTTSSLHQIVTGKRRNNPDARKSKNRSREIERRLQLQKTGFQNIAQDIHFGGKEDFLLGIALAVEKGKANNNDIMWNGSLTTDDVISMLKIIKLSDSLTLYEELVQVHSARVLHVSADEIIFVLDTKSPAEMIEHLRQRLPGFFASRRRTSALKAEMNSELAILRPKPTATGMSISPHELRLCLLYLYHWLRGEELWRFFGDACNLGKETTTILGITCINNEQALNNIKWHSPKEVWITNIFALKDSRSSLEANLGADGGEFTVSSVV